MDTAVMSFLTLQNTLNQPLKYADYNYERSNEGKHEIDVKFGRSAVTIFPTHYVSLGS